MRDLVLHHPTGLLLDFAEDDFGGEREAAVIDAWRRTHGSGHGEFICWTHRAHEKPWLYLQARGDLLVACHWPGSELAGTHEISHGVSDEHKRQVEYILRAGAAAGFDVKTEVRLPTKVRSDGVIYGPTEMSAEVQRSALTAREAKARTTKARKAGVLPIWFSDAANSDPLWLGSVPGVRMNEQQWNTVPRAGSVTVVSGTRIIVPRRCQNIPNSRCPDRRRGCNRWHPTHEPRLGTTVDDLAALVPAGELVPILFRKLSGHGEHVFIVSRNDKARYESMVGQSADLPLRQKERRPRAGSRTTCSADAGTRLCIPERPAIVAPTPGVCGAGITPCGQPARLYPGGWRCDEHIQTKRQENA